MGYTHYWEDNGSRKAIPLAALKIIYKITVDGYKRGVVQRESDDPRPPLVTPTLIRLNGVGEQGHETFYFDTKEKSEYGCSCKTAQKAYDEIVMRILLVLACFRPGMVIRSDGYFSHEWTRALSWFNENVGEAYVRERLVFEQPHPGIRIEPGMIAA